jgi:hypothetical protein
MDSSPLPYSEIGTRAMMLCSLGQDKLARRRKPETRSLFFGTRFAEISAANKGKEFISCLSMGLQ